MKYICLQENDYDCGLACIKMMLAHYHKNKKLLQLDKEIYNQRYNLHQLKNYASKYGLETQGIEFNQKELIFEYPNSIIHINENGTTHFMIFEKKKGNYTYLVDPRIGRIRLSNEHFLEIFTGYALIKDEIKPLKIKITNGRFEHLNYLLVYIIFLIFDFGILFLVSYLGNNSKFLFHNLLLILTLILSLICKLRLVTRHQNKINDNIKKILSCYKKLFTSTKNGLLSYKIYTIKYLYGLINSSFIAIFISFILVYNGLYNILIIIRIFLLSLIFSKITLVKDTTSVYKINILENEFLKSSNIEVFDDLIKESNKIQSNKSYFVIIYQMILMIGITVLNNITQIYSFQFIVFNSIYYLILLTRFNYLLKDSVSLKLEYRKYASVYNYLLKNLDNQSKMNENT